MPCADGKHTRGRPEVYGLDALNQFDEIVDVRSPAEYETDHIAGAINLPVLDNTQRARVGTIYTQVSPFEAKKVGAALVSSNIACHLESHFAAKAKGYRPLIYCWRGGSRSGALTHVLRSVGWQAAQLQGGYKAYRRQVIADLASLPGRLRFIVVCGPTGVGKSRFLRALRQLDAQVLDLEDLAAHMGSVLGAYPNRPQPSQKFFESLIWRALREYVPDKPIFVEAESRKIGVLQTPDTLLACMRDAACINLEAPVPVRVALLKEEYAHFLAAPDTFEQQLDRLLELKGRQTIAAWKALAHAGHWDELVAALLTSHYDPAYSRSLARNFRRALEGPTYRLASPQAAAFNELASVVLDSFRPVANVKL